MTNVVTYFSQNAKPAEQWLAYVVLPDGNQWLVRFTGETEEIAKGKAIRLYESERNRLVIEKPMRHDDSMTKDEEDEDITTDRRGQHFKGKAWLIHKVTRQKIRVPVEQVDEYLEEYERGGPRSR